MISLTTADNALKNMYLGVVANQLNTNVNPFLASLQHSTASVVGKQVEKLVAVAFSGGIGAGTETGGLPNSSENGYLTLKTSLKNLYGKIELTDKAIRASSSDKGAFVNLLESEMQGLIEAGKFNMSRMALGNGSGLLCTISSATKNTATMTVDSVNNLMIGMAVDVYVDGTIASAMSGARIIDWNIPNKTITLSIAFSETWNNNKTYTMYAHNSKDKELTGLGAIFDNNITSLYGNTKSSTKYLQGRLVSKTSNQYTEGVLIDEIDKQSVYYGSNPNMILMSYDMRQKYISLLLNTRINTDVVNVAGGFTAVSVNGVPMIADRFVEEGSMYIINTNLFEIHELCDWEWLSNDKGQILRQKEGYPVHTATLVKYADLICDKPCAVTKCITSA
ncbi:MAG: phage major capsid protein [Clostridia bacterium]|nr:phage major capsid protein [Clostridia bacterium]